LKQLQAKVGLQGRRKSIIGLAKTTFRVAFKQVDRRIAGLPVITVCFPAFDNSQFSGNVLAGVCSEAYVFHVAAVFPCVATGLLCEAVHVLLVAVSVLHVAVGVWYGIQPRQVLYQGHRECLC